MKFKRLLVLLLLFVAAFTLSACKKKSVTDDVVFMVGSTTELSGTNFFGTYWGNNASDKAVRDLIYGYGTIAFTRNGTYEVDKTVVKEMTTTVDGEGNKTFTFEINKGLTYNDGVKIDAKDYIFSLLLGSSPILDGFNKAQAKDGEGVYVGYKDYNDPVKNDDGKKPFAGVRLLGDYKFSVTIDKENLPYFYELTFAAVSPQPMHVIAPNADINDDGKGAYFTGEFSRAVLSKTLDSGNNEGFRFKPNVTCGPYEFVEFDATNKTATVQKNDKYKGNYEGQIPAIKTIVIKKVIKATQMQSLLNGEVDLINGVSGGEAITEGLIQVAKGNIGYADYDRNGFGLIAFHCDFGPTQFKEVRQAIAYLLDRVEFAKTYTGGFGVLPHGHYGLGQWMVHDPETWDIIKQLDQLNKYPLSIEKANQVLDNGGWTLNETGGTFVAGEGKLRHKMVDGKLMPLVINWANTPDNPVSELIRTMLPSNMAQVGMKINDETIDFSALLDHYYGDVAERQYNMYNLATGFTPVYDPYYAFHTDPTFMGISNSSFLTDEQLFNLAAELRKTDSKDKEGYRVKWLELQKRYNELLPDIPLYSDKYHEFFNKNLTGYEVDATWTWTSAILYCRMEVQK